MEQDFFNEVNILKTLSSPNITPLIEHLSQIVFQYEEEKSLRNVLVMPYAAHKDLRLEI